MAIEPSTRPTSRVAGRPTPMRPRYSTAQLSVLTIVESVGLIVPGAHRRPLADDVLAALPKGPTAVERAMAPYIPEAAPPGRVGAAARALVRDLGDQHPPKPAGEVALDA